MKKKAMLLQRNEGKLLLFAFGFALLIPCAAQLNNPPLNPPLISVPEGGPVYIVVDSDGDGMSDVWEISNEMDPLDATGENGAAYDRDSDGLSNFQEYTYDTDPNDADTDDDGLPDGWEVLYGLNPLDNGATDINQGAYGDPDVDGITNLTEYIHSTSPIQRDTDEDGLPDGWEVLYELDPLDNGSINVINGASGDPDNDILNNLGEFTNSTSPRSNDTDGDVMPDGWEVSNATDPIRDDGYEDVDHDNIPNIFEYYHNSEADNPDSMPTFSASQSGSPNIFIVDASLSSESSYEKITIQAALLVAQSWDVIYVKPGLYSGPVLIEAGKSIVLASSGGAYQTIIEGSGSDNPVVSILSGSFVSGFTVKNGYVSGNGAGFFIDAHQEYATISACLIINNDANGIGGAIYAKSGDLTLSSLTVIQNRSILGGAGLGIGIDIDNITISNCIFWNGDAYSEFSGELRFLNIYSSIIRTEILGDEGDSEILTGDPALAYGGRLTTSSVAVNAGSDSIYSIFDFDYESRDASIDAVDVGVDEFIDTDGDGLPDQWEIENSLDHLDDGSVNIENGALGDPDEDGLSNLGEYVHGGLPHDPDTDDDGYEDGLEVFHSPSSTDLRNPDTDGDLMWDGWEITMTLDPLVDDALDDLDLDRYPNVFEYFHNTDANNFNDFPIYAVSQTGSHNIYKVDDDLTVEADFEKKQIQTAIDAATEHDIIYVLAGEYMEALEVPVDKPILLISESGARQTIINAQDLEQTAVLLRSSSTMDGFTITGGRVADSGAGIRIEAPDTSSPRLLGCVITQNIAGSTGGGVYVASGNPLFTSVTINRNFAVQEGSGLAVSENASASFFSSILWNESSISEVSGQTSAVFFKESIVRNDYGDSVLEDSSSLNPLLAFASHLNSNSPAIDFITLPTLPVRYSKFDSDGEWRDATVEAVDTGADEYTDTDSDGLPDWIEALGVVDTTGDYDSDSLSNIMEYQSEINPLLDDSDQDGLTDTSEILEGTELLIKDTDGDMMPDGWEVSYNLDPLDGSDGLDDIDFDRFPSVFEYFHGTDPTLASSYPSYSETQSGPSYVFEVDAGFTTESDYGKKTLLSAISSASGHDIILVRTGTYSEAISLPANRPLLLLSLDGSRSTIIDATGQAQSVLTVQSESVVDGFTLTHGVTEGPGAGLLISVQPDDLPTIIAGEATLRPSNDKTPKFANLIIYNNRSSSDGGGVAVNLGSPIFVHSTVYRNHVDQGVGSGLYQALEAGNTSIERSIFWNPSSFDEIGGESIKVSIDASVIRAATGDAVLTQVTHTNPQLGLLGHIVSSSPALDVDSTISYSKIDADLEQRDLTADFIDRGADEFKDSDSDGLPDWLEAAGVTEPNQDNDSDTIDNIDEYNAGTDPSVADTDGDGLPDNWENAHNLDPLDSGVLFVLNGPLGDPDLDGIGNLIEYTIGTLPRVDDTDEDGLPDGWEYYNSLDPLDDGTVNVINGATGDPDADSLANLGEYTYGGDPRDSDTDDDDYLDGAEVYHSPESTDLLNPDTDGDLMTDGWEVSATLDPRSDDAYDDLDLDRFPNVFEFFHQTDANDSQQWPGYTINQMGDYHYFQVDAGFVSLESYQRNDIQEAIDAAAAFDIIEIKAGEYNEAIVVSNEKSLLLLSASGARETILSGALLGESVVTLYSESVLDGFTIKNARIENNGGGLFINSPLDASPRVLGSIITANFANNEGGGVYVESGSPVFTSVTIFSNYANSGGAAISVSEFSSASFYSSIIWNDTGVSETGGASGNIFITESIVRNDIEDAVLVGANISHENPVLGYGGHLVIDSEAIDFIILPALPERVSAFDANGEWRAVGTDDIDIGADEFIDDDFDGLPNWLEALGVTIPVLDGDSDGFVSNPFTNLEEYEYGTNPLSNDTDGDGLLDGWEVQFGLNPNDDGAIIQADGALGDPDADGLSNSEEQSYSTHPLIADSDSDSLLDGWEILHGFDPNDDGSTNIINGAAGNPDSDGLTNIDEQSAGTDPNDSDTDDDGLPDDWEVAYSLNPLDDGSVSKVNGPNGDPDSDTLRNSREYALGTHPRSQDSDGDGLPDKWEVFYGLNPSSTIDPNGADGDPNSNGIPNIDEYANGTSPVENTDTDGDGLPDWWEMSYFETSATADPDTDGLNNLGEYTNRTNPNDDDTDDDGLPDGWEVTWGLSPIDDGTIDVKNGATGDFDSDGLSNLFEYNNNLKPNTADGDNDELKDAWEITYFEKITQYGTYDDPDGDSFTNIQEYKSGSNPLDKFSIPPEAPSDEVNGEGDNSQSSLLASQQSSTIDSTSFSSETETIAFVSSDQMIVQNLSSEDYISAEEDALQNVSVRVPNGDGGNVYKLSDWFGEYFVDYERITTIDDLAPFRWVFHGLTNEWAWIQGTSPTNVWVWDAEIGWIWLNNTDFRADTGHTWFYHFATKTWYFYESSTKAPQRWFNRSSDREWLFERELSVQYEDGNSIPDSWERFHFGDTGHENDADPDDDGLTNLQEYLLDWNPLNRSPAVPEYDNDSDGLVDAWEYKKTLGSVEKDSDFPAIQDSLNQLNVSIQSPSEGQPF